MIEVMIAVVVFSFGLLGVAGVMTVSVKNNHNGYMRSQAAFLASSMIESIRRNQLALWAGNYQANNLSGYSDVSTACVASACLPAALAARDMQQWSNMLTQILPNSTGTINCVPSAPPISQIPVQIQQPANSGNLVNCLYCAVEPYNGFCTITITWTESDELSTQSGQTFTLVSKP